MTALLDAQGRVAIVPGLDVAERIPPTYALDHLQEAAA